MPTNYCPSCGGGTKYDLSSPKFCSHCGSTFANAVGALTTPPRTPAIQAAPARPKLVPYREDDEPDFSEIRVPDKLDIEVEIEPPRHRTSLGSIMQGSKDSVTVEKGNKLSKKARQVQVQTFRNKLNTVERHNIGGGE